MFYAVTEFIATLGTERSRECNTDVDMHLMGLTQVCDRAFCEPIQKIRFL